MPCILHLRITASLPPPVVNRGLLTILLFPVALLPLVVLLLLLLLLLCLLPKMSKNPTCVLLIMIQQYH